MINPLFRKTRFPVFLLLLLSATGSVWGQVSRPMPGPPTGIAPAGGGDKVELIHADSLNIVNQPGVMVRRLINNVKLQQKGVVLYCDLAIQNTTTNVIEAYGNVRMVQGDTINVRGDTLYYYGNTRQANVLGHVVLKDRKMTLSTARLDYDMLTGLAHYPVKGRIIDRENTLTSEEGDYYTGNKQFIFKRNVRLLNQPPGKEKTTILGDSLLYNSLSKIADFQGPTRIISKDGTLVARNGQYNTITRISNFRQRATAETEKYTLTGDTLNFDNVNEVGVAHGNVVIVNKADRTTLTGDHGRYNGKAGVSRMIGHAVVRSPISQGGTADTLFMRADTLFSFDNKLTKRKKLIGHKNVLVFKSDLQSRCDSLVYDVNDSLLYFYRKPIVWSQNYQMEADSMTARLKNNHINTMFLKTRAFVISQDTLLNFNQVKGRQITANFRTILAPVKKTGRPTGPMTASSVNRPALSPIITTTATAEKTTLDRVLVEGNGQTIYFAVDEKNRLVGMNRTECSKMNIEFTDSRVTRIRNYGRPDMFLTPPKELTDEKKQLDGFRWREKEKPTRAQTLGLTPVGEPKPAAPTSTVALLRDKIQTVGADAARTAAGLPVDKLTAALPAANALARSIAPVVDKLAVAVTKPASGQLIASKPVVTKALEPVISKPASRSLAAAPMPMPIKAALSKPVAPVVARSESSQPVVAVPKPKPSPDSTAGLPSDSVRTAIVIDPINREPLLDKPVAPLFSRPVKPMVVKKPAVVSAKPMAVQPVMLSPSVVDALIDSVNAVVRASAPAQPVEPIGGTVTPVLVTEKPKMPVATGSVITPTPVAKPTETLVAEPAKKPLVDKVSESAKPVAVSSSRSTLPTRRAEKQQKLTNQLTPKLKVKPETTAPAETDLERELNHKPRNQ